MQVASWVVFFPISLFLAHAFVSLAFTGEYPQQQGVARAWDHLGIFFLPAFGIERRHVPLENCIPVS